MRSDDLTVNGVKLREASESRTERSQLAGPPLRQDGDYPERFRA